MASHNQLGKDAENLASNYLQEKGYKILFRNWRYSYYEIDIIAEKNNKLHILEVKSLKATTADARPEDAVSRKKFRFLLNAADEFLHQHPEYRHVQYDILAITYLPNKPPEMFLIEDVYYY